MTDKATSVHKMIRTDPNDWKTYKQIADHLSKEAGFKIYINNAVKVMAQEYISRHPELDIK